MFSKFDLVHIAQRMHYHSDLNDQNLFHSTIDAPPGVPGHSGRLAWKSFLSTIDAPPGFLGVSNEAKLFTKYATGGLVR